MFEGFRNFSILILDFAIIWFFVSIFRIGNPNSRISAKRQVKWSAGLFVLCLIASIVFSQLIYKDYGLSSQLSLTEVIAARKAETEAKVAEGNKRKEQVAVAQKEAEAKLAAEASLCGVGKTIAVSSSYDLRVAPKENADRIINQKATDIIKTIQYHTVDNSTTLKVLACSAEWTQVQITETSWLTDVSGWVPTEILRKIDKTPDGIRVYVDSDIDWDDDTDMFKEKIITMINKISRETAGCNKINTSSLAKSTSRSKPNDPVFFITCGEGSSAFNVWFRPTDVGTNMTATPPIEQGNAVIACEQAAKRQATHPSTVDFSRFLDVSYSARPDGRVALTSSFSAKNSFNLELKYKIRCLFDGNKMIEATINEAQ